MGHPSSLFVCFLTSAIVWSHFGGLVSGSCGDTTELAPECTEEFENSPGHTMCICHDDSRVTKSGVSNANKNLIVDLHNQLRGGVNPPATDMPKVVWDDKIAEVAQKWAKQCEIGHDNNREIPSYSFSIGQNAAGGQSNWNDVIMGWYNEVEDFQYGVDPETYLEPGQMIGHYTQIVQNVTFLVGCGYAKCKKSTYKRYYICNYGTGQSRLAEPYTNGERCSTCPDSCQDGLCVTPITEITSPHGCKYYGVRPSQEQCAAYGDNGGDKSYCASRGGPWDCDMCAKYSNVKTDCPVMCGYCDGPCDGLTCNNGGTLDRDSCTCSCKTNYGGDKCETFNCPESESSYCWTYYKPEHCEMYTNVPQTCPKMCGLCGEDAAKPPPVSTSSYGCTYEGERPTKEQCKSYGDGGKDTFACATQGGDWGCNECTQYTNVKTQYCPVMCAYCDP